MKFEKCLINIRSFILYILLINAFNCKDIFEECSNLNYPLFISLGNNMDSSFDSEIINKKINTGEVQTEIMSNEKIYNFTFNVSNYDNKSDLFVFFHPLDCQIKIAAISSENIQIYEISNYEYNAYYAIVKKNKLNITNFKIKPLINPLNANNINRAFHLIINSFEKKRKSNLFIKEKESILLNFDNNLNNITLVYKLNKIEYPILVYFFIKERVKFEITVSNEEKNSFKKRIFYNDKILIYNDFLINSSYININIKKSEKDKNCVMIARIIENHLIPKYL